MTCGPNSVTFTVRTQRPMSGRMYAQNFHDDSKCSLIADRHSRELSLNFVQGNCGLVKIPSPVKFILKIRTMFNYFLKFF